MAKGLFLLHIRPFLAVGCPGWILSRFNSGTAAKYHLNLSYYEN